MLSEKRCARCRHKKPLSEFHKQGKGRYHSYCKSCWREYRTEHPRKHNPEKRSAQNWRARYGLSQEEVAALIAKQNGRCGICKSELGKAWRIDHDHETGRVRGALCHRCNVLLAGFEDPDFARAAREWLAQ